MLQVDLEGDQLHYLKPGLPDKIHKELTWYAPAAATHTVCVRHIPILSGKS